MIEGLVDTWTLWHVLGALSVGLFLGLLIRSRKVAAIFAVIVPIVWETIEANIFVSWFGILEAEPFLNSIFDIGIGFGMIMIGFILTEYVMKK